MDSYRGRPKHQQHEFNDKPPLPEERLVQILQVRKSKTLPISPLDAAHFWMDHQEQPDEYSDRIEKIVIDGKQGWKTPYHDRIAHNLNLFLSLPDVHQFFVLENCKRVPWRGDSIDFYVDVIDEEKIMRQNPDEYRASAKTILRSMDK